MQGVFYMRNSKGLFSTLAYFTMFIFGLQVCGQQFILLDIAEEYGMNNTAMGALSSVGFIAGLCSTVLLGGLIDKKNQRLLTAVCTAAMWVIFAALHLVGWVKFDYTVVLGGLVGAAVAVANFAGICFVVQKILDEPDEKRRKAKLQLSHNSRMLMQAVWVIVAIAAPCFQPFASVLPLFFPRITIYYLQITGKYKPLAAAPAQDVSVEDAPAEAPAQAEAPGEKGGET